MAQIKLPDDFFFGAAMSGPQTEGAWQADGRVESLWDTWSNERIEDFHNRVGSYAGNDFTRRYAEDFKLLASMGLSSVRTSIQWSRLLDADGNVNPAGEEYYHKVFAAAKDAGIELFVNLYHFDMPTYLFRRGGWESRQVVEAYADYAAKAFAAFGKEIRCWFTFNEPIVEPDMRYTMGEWYPFIKNYTRARSVQYNISVAHSLGVRAFRAAKAAGQMLPDARIGLINCFTPPYTKENPSKGDLEAVRMTDGVNNRWWLDLVTEGKLPADVLETLSSRGIELPIRPEDERILADGKVDWLGCNYYHPERVQAPAHDTDPESGCPCFADPYEWPEAKMNKSRGWEIYPQGIYDFGMMVKRDYPDLEWFVSENGMGVEREDLKKDASGQIQDDYRIDFVQQHLYWIAKAVQDGAKCRGYHYWAVIDNWSWAHAFKNRYGFIEVDLEDDYNRRPKKSASWLRHVIATHVIEGEEN
ncbi:MAG: glycoside hydrolase family 1 protein [Atopobiaceae bacterium]|jgi:6-phospho-beta-glucosidase|nr:glycoside hydrolase family 1 protein [Atopobiaceae bacterium]MCH4214953.1 glycoside hydrolase family 1 protein [Atopobiaceae bacterium]MCH4277104.1 glycoside hydrolase family 1 protein [Atopobiaceae bacterium]MCI1227265.1 glycoside hydrolase family 1 protein [Atopobiaceae bacterium]MCI1260072.1 glycoside hydrolase family 1 protein [Atopobiaceae bacterium]